MIAVILAAAVVAAVFIPWARRLDRADLATEYHILHGSNSVCPECEES